MAPTTAKAAKRAAKSPGGRPSVYDDTEILSIAAELLAWPEVTGFREREPAFREAIRYIIGSDGWAPEKVDRIVERLKGKYQRVGPEIEAQSRARETLVMHNGRAFPYAGPQLPTLLTAPREPEIALARSRASAMVSRLRRLATLATELADALDTQLARCEMPSHRLLNRGDELVMGLGEKL